MKGGNKRRRLVLVRYRTLISLAALVGAAGGAIAAAYHYALEGMLHLVWEVAAARVGRIWLITGLGGRSTTVILTTLSGTSMVPVIGAASLVSFLLTTPVELIRTQRPRRHQPLAGGGRASGAAP